jgi:hypothetical protein
MIIRRRLRNKIVVGDNKYNDTAERLVKKNTTIKKKKKKEENILQGLPNDIEEEVATSNKL